MLIIKSVSFLDPNSCEFEQNIYEDGEDWMTDDCTTCKCSNGKIDCHIEKCPEIVCLTNKYIPSGKCCPVCVHDQEFKIVRV